MGLSGTSLVTVEEEDSEYICVADAVKFVSRMNSCNAKHWPTVKTFVVSCKMCAKNCRRNSSPGVADSSCPSAQIE